LYVSDLEDWIVHSSAVTYADDTTTSTHSKELHDLIKKMELDAVSVLKFMASNGLIANPAKTSLLFLNLKNSEEGPIEMKIGKEKVKQENMAKLLGMQFDDTQQWKNHLYNKGGLISSLNSRLFMIKRLKNSLSSTALQKIVDGLFTSKLRYGLQLLGKVRKSDEDPKNAELQAIQKIQNKVVRMLNNVKLSDRTNTATLLKRIKMLSVNQMNAQIKLGETWKSMNMHNYPTEFKNQDQIQLNTSTRACTNGGILEEGHKTLSLKSFKCDSARLWNSAPSTIKNCITLNDAKKEIR
jgi:hypothetical protein